MIRTCRKLCLGVFIYLGLFTHHENGMALHQDDPLRCNSDCSDEVVTSEYTKIHDPGCNLANSWGSGSGRGPGAVQDLEVQASSIPYNGSDVDETRESWSRIHVSWSAPLYEERHGLEAFAVRITDLWRMSSDCFIYNLTYNGTINPPGKFSDSCMKCSRSCGINDAFCSDQDGHIEVEILSLPDTEFNHLSEKASLTISGPKMSDRRPALSDQNGCWTTDISIIQNTCTDETRVTFQAPPSVLWFSDFRITYAGPLYVFPPPPDHAQKIVGSSGNNFYTVTFDGNPKVGTKWRIVVRPFARDTCYCSDSSQCFQTTTYNFNISDVPDEGCTPMTTSSVENSSTNPQGPRSTLGPGSSIPLSPIYSTGSEVTECHDCHSPVLQPAHIAGIVGGCALAVILALVIFLIIRKKKQPPALMQHRMDIKKVVILYSHDYPCHQKVLREFSIFLRDKCFCDVVVDQWHQSNIAVEKVNWLPRQLENADKVIIVISHGTAKKIDCFVNSKELKPSKAEDPSYNEDNFLEGYSYLVNRGLGTTNSPWTKKVIGVRFSYIPDYCAELESVKKAFKFPTRLRPLLQNIHGVKHLPNPLEAVVSSPLEKNIDVSLPVYEHINQPNANDPRVKLEEEINFMCRFADAHPSWFNDYHEFRDFDTQTDSYNSQSDSCSNNTPDSRSVSASSDTFLIPNVNKKNIRSQALKQPHTALSQVPEISCTDKNQFEAFGPFVGTSDVQLVYSPLDGKGKETDAVSDITDASEFIRTANANFDTEHDLKLPEINHNYQINV